MDLRGFALSPERDVDITVSEMSYGGCKIHSAETFKPGELLELRIIRRGRIDAEVRWSSDGTAGAKFVGEGESTL